MKLKMTVLAGLLLAITWGLMTTQEQAETDQQQQQAANKPEVGVLSDDQIPPSFQPLPGGTEYGIALPGRMVQPPVSYQTLSPELQGQLTMEMDTTPKFRKGGFRYEKISPEELAQVDQPWPEEQPETKSLVSSISAGGQVTNSVNNGGFIFIPADPHGAAGPNQVVNVFNTTIEFYDTDGTNGSSRSLETFFAPVSPVNFTFDPKVLYDQYEDRFVVITLERQDTANGDPDDTSRVLVAVSATSDPNGAWFMHAFDSEVFISGADRWFDYPGFAVDEEVVYITGNMFGYGAGGYGGVRLWMIDKVGFYSGGAVSVIGPLDPYGGGGVATTTQPAHTYGTPPAGMGTYLMSYSRLAAGGNEFWQTVRVDNPLGAVSFTQQFLGVGNIEPNVGPLPSAPQSGSGLTLETNDPRALDAVWRDGQVFSTATIESNTELGETSASWWVFDGNGGAIALDDFGIIDGEDISAGTFTFFPSIAVNADGGIGVGYSASSPSIFPGSYFSVRSPGDAAGTMRASEAIRVGTDFYHRAFGGTNRWGDYTSVAVDPNDECFWVYNKHAVTNTGGATESGLYETAFGEFCNQDPNAVNDSITVNEGATTTLLDGGSGTVLNNDSDPDASDSLVAVLVSGPADASSFSLNANGTFSYSHNGDEAPTDSFTYNACDDGTPVKCNLATVNIGINGIDDDPTAVADADTVLENSSNNVIDVLDNDTDPDGGLLEVTAVTQPSNGSTTFTAANVSYTPDADYCNDGVTTDDFNYTINGGSSATVAVTVTCQANADPVAVDDNATTDEDVMVSVAVLTNDSDPDAGDTLSVTSCSGASNGTVVQNGNNCEFTPALNFNGSGGFNYAISDGNGGSDTASVTVTVDPVNDDPVAVDDAATTDEDVMVSVAVLTGDSDVDAGDTLSVTSCSGASNGSVVQNGNNCEFTPALNFNGTGGFNYAISDGNGGSDTASVTVTVDPVNDDPVAVDDAATTDEDVMVSVAVLTGDSDVDAGDTLSVTSCSGASNGSVVQNGNNCEYTPALNFNGTGGFTYAISDGNGGNDSASVTVTIDPVNDDPVAVDDAATTDEDVMVSVAVLTGDSDIDPGDTLSVTACSGASNGSVVRVGNNCEFTPALNFNGTGGFNYTISDGNGGSDSAAVTVTVDPVNDDPVAADDAAVTNEDTLVSVAVLTGDSDPDAGDTLSVTACTGASNGTVVRVGNNCEFTPALNFNGTGGFNYAISDGNGGNDSASVTVTVDPVNDDPVAVDDNANTTEDTMVSVAVLNGDSDPDLGDTLSVTSCSNASNGTVVQNGNNCEFTPAADFNGSGGFDYAISDGNGGSDSAAVAITVDAVNDEPSMVINDVVYLRLADLGSPPVQSLACQFDFGPNDEDADQAVRDMIVNIQSDPNGVLSSIDVDNNGDLVYVISGNAGAAEVTVALQDDGGVANGGDDTSVTYTFTVNVQDYVFRNDFETLNCP
ncbi:Ig-like domain-containing protein [Marinicella meishanensis]|uniref:Ig-like domain-containing protein n=1 Tax=Marinicella meishanensis TaxID=2873263 RepID=UPI001CBD8D5F|nr:Ig-like domain-containing protein [Marinicella sp. NBU2979]